MDLEVVRERIRIMEKLEEENKISKEMLKSALENDEEYKESVRVAKEYLTKKKRLKDQIWSQDGNRKTVEDIKSNLEEINTLREILSAELMEFYSEKKTDEIKDANGESRKFKLSVRIMPKGYRPDDRDNFGKFIKDQDLKA